MDGTVDSEQPDYKSTARAVLIMMILQFNGGEAASDAYEDDQNCVCVGSGYGGVEP